MYCLAPYTVPLGPSPGVKKRKEKHIKVPQLNPLNTVPFSRTLKRLGGEWHTTRGAAKEVDGDKFVCMDRIMNKKAQIQNWFKGKKTNL